MKTVSFAQNHEDILLARAFAGRDEGFYIDVGACHPVLHSVTKLFYERGWRGVNIEPIPRIFEVLSSDRPRDVNLSVGLSNREGTLRFHEVPAELGSSTFSLDRTCLPNRGIELVEHRIPVTTLARVCEEHAESTIDFLKIDAEAHEREVIEGGDWDRFRPRIVLVEATRVETWEPLLLAAGYLFAQYDGLNRYYVRVEDREELMPRLVAPVNFFDEFESFEHRCRIDELERQVEELRRSNASYWAASGAGAAETFERMRAELQSVQAELDTARDRLALIEGWGPITIGVAARLRGAVPRVPLLKRLLRRAALGATPASL